MESRLLPHLQQPAIAEDSQITHAFPLQKDYFYSPKDLMKKTSLLFLFLLLQQLLPAQTPEKKGGIEFRNISFGDAILAARQEKKPIFMHAYASWCHFCQAMVDSVYTQKAAGDYYNKNFICIKVDMEKEGREMNKKLKVQNYPTHIFFEPTSIVMVHRVAGKKDLAEFLEAGHDALDTTKQLRTYEQKYYNKTGNTQDILTYFRMLEKAGLDNQVPISTYLGSLPDPKLLDYDNWRIMYDLFKDVEMPAFQKVMLNRSAYKEKYTADSIDNKIISLYNSALMTRIQKLDTLGYKNMIEKLGKSGLDLSEKIIAFAELNKSKLRSDWKRYQIEAVPFVEKYCKDDYRRLNEIAYNFYERVYDKAMLAKALEWSKEAVKIQNTIRNNYTLACLHYKLGNRNEAETACKLTIEMAKQAGVDQKQPLLLLDKIYEIKAEEKNPAEKN